MSSQTFCPLRVSDASGPLVTMSVWMGIERNRIFVPIDVDMYSNPCYSLFFYSGTLLFLCLFHYFLLVHRNRSQSFMQIHEPEETSPNYFDSENLVLL